MNRSNVPESAGGPGAAIPSAVAADRCAGGDWRLAGATASTQDNLALIHSIAFGGALLAIATRKSLLTEDQAGIEPEPIWEARAIASAIVKEVQAAGLI